MAKRDKSTITLGSGKIYLEAFSDTMPTVDTICVDDNRWAISKAEQPLNIRRKPTRKRMILAMCQKSSPHPRKLFSGAAC